MVSPDEQLQQQQIEKAEKQQDFKATFSSGVNEAAASVSTLAKPKKMKDLTVTNSSGISDLPGNKDQSNSKTIYGINTQNYKNKIGCQIAAAQKSTDDLGFNPKRTLSLVSSQSSPSRRNDAAKDLMIDFPNSHDETVFNDVQGFLNKSGFAVPPTSFGRLLGCDSRLALSKLSLKSSNGSFVDYSSIDASLSTISTAGSTIKSPTFSMSDIAVVVPSHVVFSDSNSEENGTDDELASDLDKSSSAVNNSSSDYSFAEDDLEYLERPFESSNCLKNVKVSPKSDCDLQSEAVKIDTPVSSSDCIVDPPLQNGGFDDQVVKNINRSENSVDIGNIATLQPINCHGNFRIQISCEEQSISEPSLSSSKISFEGATDGQLHCLPSEEKSVNSETATDSTNNAPESCCSFDFAEELVDPFEDGLNTLNDDASEWQFVGNARNKQKRKQNRTQSNGSKRQDRHQARKTFSSNAVPTKEQHDRLNISRPAYYTTPRNIPNRILRAKAKQQRINTACKLHTASANVKVSSSYSSFSRTSDTTEVIWSKPIAQTRPTIQVNFMFCTKGMHIQ